MQDSGEKANIDVLPEDADKPAPAGITREKLRDGSLLAAWRASMPPGVSLRTDEELEASLDATLARHPPGADVWVFGYGSLMWNPAFEFVEKRLAILRGYHRRFCVETRTGRGTHENPGLALALDGGGSCRGIAFRLADHQIREELLLVWRREMVSGAHEARWVDICFDAKGRNRGKAVTFFADHGDDRYAGGLTEREIAKRIATARGTLGSCREYLASTIHQLRELGIPDSGVERINRSVIATLPHTD
jgi:cation transport protein ChaC